MTSERTETPQDEATKSDIQALFTELYKGEIKPEEQRILTERRRFYESLPGDIATFDAVEALRQTTESADNWKKIAEGAEKEITAVPSDMLEKLFRAFAPYIKSMPAGHGRGHFLRDSINLTTIINDPSFSSYPPPEALAGMVAAIYHDIGTSVVPRYDDNKRFAAHAEVGAHLFGEIARGILPENLLKMTQLAIAAHTHITKDVSITRNSTSGAWIDENAVEITDVQTGQPIAVDTLTGNTKLKNKKTGQETTAQITRRRRKPYDDKIENGQKRALWIPRWSDRLDTRGVPHAVRHIITKASPTHDFTDNQFHQVGPDELKDFEKHFEPKKNAETKDVLYHLNAFADSDTANPPVYNAHDTNYMSNNLFGPQNTIQREFIKTVEEASASLQRMTPEQQEALRKEGLEKFFSLARLLEPAPDTEAQIKLLQDKFTKLGTNTNSWALGFKQLYDKLYPETIGKKEELLRNKPTVKYSNQVISDKVNDLIGNHLYVIAQTALSHFRLPA